MAKEIKVQGKKQSVKVTDITNQDIAPELPPFLTTHFKQLAIPVLENKLLEMGIIIPVEVIDNLTPALVEIGKIYYNTVSPKQLF